MGFDGANTLMVAGMSMVRVVELHVEGLEKPAGVERRVTFDLFFFEYRRILLSGAVHTDYNR